MNDLSDEEYEARFQAEIHGLISRINDQAVCQLASQLNGGRACGIEHLDKVGPGAFIGTANYHPRIRFHDASTSWLLRVPRVNSRAAPPVSLVDYLIKSEYATLKYLENTTIPAPRAFAYGTFLDGADAGIGVGFLLIEELPGRPWHRNGPSGENATDKEEEKIWEGLADILAKLERHPFPKAGSLTVASTGVKMGPVASDRFLVLDPAGPFETAAEYYTAISEQYLSLIADGQIYAEYPVNADLVYRFLKDNVTQILEEERVGADGEPAQDFFLKHVDDKGDHLLVDEDLNITGIIDWQMSRFVPRREAFGPSLVSADMNALYNGGVCVSLDDFLLSSAHAKRGGGLGGSMADGRERWFCWGLGMKKKWEHALPSANAILKAFGIKEGWLEWRERALREYHDDGGLQKLLSSS